MDKFIKSIEIIEQIKKVDLESDSSYSQIFGLISQMYIPIDYTKQLKGSFLFRARRNSKPNEYHFKDEISYNHDFRKIKEFGRVNEIGQSIFYATNKLETSIIETSFMIKDKDRFEGIERFTIGRWRVIEDIDIIAMISNEEAYRVNDIIKRLYSESLAHKLANNETNKIRKYFSDEFAKKCNHSKSYQISCAYFNYIISQPYVNAWGIIYPSVGYEYQDINIALLPSAVDTFLILDSVFEYEINMKNSFMEPKAVIDIKAWNTNEI